MPSCHHMPLHHFQGKSCVSEKDSRYRKLIFQLKASRSYRNAPEILEGHGMAENLNRFRLVSELHFRELP